MISPLTEEQQELAIKYYPSINSILYSLKLYDNRYRDDIESAAMLALISSAAKYNSNKHKDFLPLLKTSIKRRVISDVWRRNKILKTLKSISFDIEEEFDDLVCEIDLEGLTERQKEVLRLYFVEEKDLRKIASIYSCSHAYIFKIKKKALQILKERLSNA